MSVIATIESPAEEFTLGKALSTNSGIRVRLERVVPLGSTLIPYFWAEDGSVEAIERALRAEADIESFEIVDRVDGEALVRVEWREDLDGLVDAMVTTDATILQGVGSAERWRFQLRFDDHDSLTQFYRRCRDHDLTFELRSVHDPGTPADQPGLGLTRTQRDTLEAALANGYFEIPRRITLAELAAELGVSDTAVSQRLRRGLRTLLTATLSESEEPDT